MNLLQAKRSETIRYNNSRFHDYTYRVFFWREGKVQGGGVMVAEAMTQQEAESLHEKYTVRGYTVEVHKFNLEGDLEVVDVQPGS